MTLILLKTIPSVKTRSSKFLILEMSKRNKTSQCFVSELAAVIHYRSKNFIIRQVHGFTNVPDDGQQAFIKTMTYCLFNSCDEIN